MKKTIIFGALAALLGLAAVAQASDDDRSYLPGAGQMTQERTTDGRVLDHDRYERREHTRDLREDRDNDDRDGHHQDREWHRRDRD